MLSKILIATSVFFIGLIGAAPATASTLASGEEQEYDRRPGCEIQLTASFEDEEVDYEPLDLGDTALSGAGGSPGRASTTVTVRVRVDPVAINGAHGELGQPNYFPDKLLFGWSVRVSPPTWQFIWGGFFYSLSYNGRSTFHGEFLHPLASRPRGQEWVSTGVNIIYGQRIPPAFHPADLIERGTSVTFRPWERTPRGEGRLTLKEVRPPFRDRTVPYTVRPPAECTKVAH